MWGGGQHTARLDPRRSGGGRGTSGKYSGEGEGDEHHIVLELLPGTGGLTEA
jgi:hypothetical protein